MSSVDCSADVIMIFHFSPHLNQKIQRCSRIATVIHHCKPQKKKSMGVKSGICGEQDHEIGPAVPVC
jgi:hypothetical protein